MRTSFFKNTFNQKGFTLIEISIVLIIIGFILVGAIQAYTIYNEKQKIERTNLLMTDIENYIENFPNMIDPSIPGGTTPYNRLPCPAPLNSSAAGNNYSNEDCSMAEAAPGVMVGKLPANTMGIRNDYMKDVYGNYLIYAVSTPSTTDLNATGTIRVREEVIDQDLDSATVGEIIQLPTLNNVKYVVFSAGKNQAGAIAHDGTSLIPCNNGGRDSENCNFANGVFLASVLSQVDAATQYDDVMRFESNIAGTQTANAGGCTQTETFKMPGSVCPDGWQAISSITSADLSATYYSTTSSQATNSIPVLEPVIDIDTPPKYYNVDPETGEYYFTDFETPETVFEADDNSSEFVACEKSANNTATQSCFNKNVATAAEGYSTVANGTGASSDTFAPIDLEDYTYEELEAYCPEGYKPISRSYSSTHVSESCTSGGSMGEDCSSSSTPYGLSVTCGQ